jgi:hypothetical protein
VELGDNGVAELRLSARNVRDVLADARLAETRPRVRHQGNERLASRQEPRVVAERGGDRRLRLVRRERRSHDV